MGTEPKRNWKEIGLIVAILAGVQAMGWAMPWTATADIAVLKSTVNSIDKRLERLEDTLITAKRTAALEVPR